MKALILAAGKGERLKPITDKTPKVMIKIGNKPCLQHNIELLKKYGIKNIAINTHYLPEKIKNYFSDGKSLGVNISYSYEPKILGTSGSLNNFKYLFKEPFFVICGDLIHKTDLRKMINFHKEKGGIITIALDCRDQIGKGVAIIDKNKRVIKFIEKPTEEISMAVVNSGVYLCEPEILNYIPPEFSDFGKDIFPKLIKKNKKIYGFEAGKVIDIGTFSDLAEARRNINNFY
jgi:NDP-sugar pyrophosphorylase family protein